MHGGEEEKKPDFMSHHVTITQVCWINNNEILIGQRDLSNSSMGDRIIKYNVRENKFLPVYNENFEREETLGFSKDGKTLFIYDEKNGTVSLKRNDKIIYRKDFTPEAHSLMGLEKSRKIWYGIYPAVVEKDWAIATFSGIRDTTEGDKTPELPICVSKILYLNTKDTIEKIQYLEGIHEQEGYDIHELFRARIVRQIVRRNDDLLFIAGFKSMYSLSLSDFSLERIFSFPGNNLFDCSNQIIQSGDKFYFTASFSSGYLHKKSKNMNEYSPGDLFIYNTKSKKIKCIRENVDHFDISKDYFVMTFSTWKFDDKHNFEDLFQRTGKILVLNKDNICLYLKQFNIHSKRMNPWGGELIPIISPDQKWIVIFKNYCNEKPIVIDTEELE